MDGLLREVIECSVGQRIPLEVGQDKSEGDGVVRIGVPVRELNGRTLQRWLMELTVRQGGMGVECQEDLITAAFVGGLE